MKPFQITMPSLRAKRRVQDMQQAQEERVSLIDDFGQPTPEPSHRRRVELKEPWTVRRLMRYLSLTAVSAMVTFFVLGRESRALHWQEFHHLLQPELKTEQSQRCYSERRHGQHQRCSCPDPSLPLANTDMEWKNHHTRLVEDAKKAPKNLDIVFLGDAIVERWNGTKDLGTKVLPGDMREPFEKRFTTKGGGKLEGLALGSSADTGPNLLWHIQNGLINPINPKLWFISIGTNDLFEEKCTDRFVVASILNVIKLIHEIKPNAVFIIHGILPRKDNPKSKSQFLQKKWKYAQTINTQIRKFCERSPRLYYMQAGPLFLEETDSKGRRQIVDDLLENGVYPTKKGLEKWGDYIVKRVLQILKDLEEQKKTGRQLPSSSSWTIRFGNWTISP